MSIGEWMELYENNSSMSLQELRDELKRLVEEGEGESLRGRALRRLLRRIEKEFCAEYDE